HPEGALPGRPVAEGRRSDLVRQHTRRARRVPREHEGRMCTWMTRHPQWLAVALGILGAAFYWSLIATDRYVSEANVVLQSARMPQTEFSVSSFLSGGLSGDLLMLRVLLLSVDML